MSTPQDAWAEYTDLALRLDEVRRAEETQTGGLRRSSVAARERITELSEHLTRQQELLSELARRIRQPRPAFPVPPPAPAGSLDEALREAARHADEVAEAGQEAERIATQPVLLPYWSARGRNAVVYGIAALGALAGQLVLLGLRAAGGVDWWTAAAWSLFGVPTIAFFVGYLLVGVLAVPRTGTERVDRTPRLGFTICLASLPVWVVLTELARNVF